MSKNKPYVGPRTFRKEEGNLFFGREREARDLSALIATEKLVLFYAQSGAGKSSIINTRLIPELEAEFYEVLPKGRVSGESFDGVEVQNIYIYNLMRSLIRREIDPTSIAGLTLSQFLGRLNEDEDGYFYDADLDAPIRGNPDVQSWKRALIIDQFEEIFTTSIDAWDKRDDFFQQLGKAMEDDPHLWVVLTMRDDYIASLDPYAYHLPGGLRVRYYMQRLGQRSAVEAVKSPAEKFGRPFADGVAEKLVENLASIYVKKSGNTKAVAVKGQFVEPVQLQVICQSLWKSLSAGNQITQADVDKLGDVDQALEKYYDERVLEVEKETGVPQRTIRKWFERDLITSAGTRNMVLRNTSANAGLEDRVIRAFLGDLVREELRAGQIWYELSHDRLIEPVQKSNAAWFKDNLRLFQRQADLWMEQDRSGSLLLRGMELRTALREAKSLSLTRTETEFLAASKRAMGRSILVWASVAIALIVMGVLSYVVSVQSERARASAVFANQQRVIAEEKEVQAVQNEREARKSQAEAEEARRNAEEQGAKALAGNLAAQANALKNTNHSLALLLGIEAVKREDSLLTRTTLFQLLQYTPYERQFDYNGPVTSVAISPAGDLIATASCKEIQQSQCAYGEIILTDASTYQVIHRISGDFGSVSSLAFSPDGTVLAAGGCVPLDEDDRGCTDSKGQITLWDVHDPDKSLPLGENRREHVRLVKSIAFSPDGKLIASGGFDQRIVLWQLSDSNELEFQIRLLEGHSSFVNSLAFSRDGKSLVSAGDDRAVLIWDISNSDDVPEPELLPQAHNAPISAIAFSPDGNKFASAGDDKFVFLWDWNSTTHTLQKTTDLKGHSGYVKSVTFNEDGTVLASAGFDNKVILWDTGTGEQIGPPLEIHTKAINAIAFGSTLENGTLQPYLVSVSDDRSAIQWKLASRRPLSQSLNLSKNNNWTPISDTGPYTIADRPLSVELNGQTVKLLSENREYLLLEDFDSVVENLYFYENNLITRDENDSVIQWNMNTDDWIEIACAAAKRNLTPSEWEQYLQDTSYEPSCIR